MSVTRWFTPLFGTEMLGFLVVAAIINAVTGPHPHTSAGFVVGYVLAGLFMVGMLAQLVSIPWIKRLSQGQHVLWWIGSAIYLLFILMVVPWS